MFRVLQAALHYELGDAGFVEFAEAFGDHAVVLLLGRARERQMSSSNGLQKSIDSSADAALKLRSSVNPKKPPLELT